MENPTVLPPPPAPAPAPAGAALLALPPSTTTANHGGETRVVIDFVSLSSTTTSATTTSANTSNDERAAARKHPAENLYWINIADVDGIAPPRDRNGEGGRYWPCLFYEGGYDEAMKDVDRSQKGFLSKLQKEKLKEQNRNLFFANAANGGAANAAPPSSRPVFIPLGITPHRAIPLHDGIRTKSQAESQGLLLDYWEGYDNVKALRGFPNVQILEAAQRANIDVPIPNTDPPISKFDRAFQFASDIVDHRAELHDDTSSEDYGNVFENFRTSNNGGQMALLPPSTAPAPSAGASAPGTNGSAARMTTNRIAAVSTTQRGGPPNASAHNPLVSPVPFALGAPAAVMMDDGPTEEQDRVLDAIMGGGGAPTAVMMDDGPTEEQARALDAIMGGGGGGVPPAQDRRGNDMTDDSPPGGEIHTSAPGRVSISPRVQVMGGTLADGNEDEENKDKGGTHIAPEKEEGEEQDEKVQGQEHNEQEDEYAFPGQMSDADDDDENEETIITPGKVKKSTDNDSDEEDLPDNTLSPILRKDPWQLVLPKLQKSGWKYKPPADPLDSRWTYFRPGKINKADAVEGVDFFHGEMAVKEYIRATIGWRGQPGDFDEEDLLKLNPRDRRNRGQNKNVYSPSGKTAVAVEEQTKNKKKVGKAKTDKKANAHKKVVAKKTPTSKKKTSGASSMAVTPAPAIDPNAPKIRGTPIYRADHWVTVWDKLEYTGWKRVLGSDLMTDYFYILPHAAKWWKKSNKGKEGVDYFTREEDVRGYCAKTYGWDPEGAEKARMKEKADAGRKAPGKRKAAADAEASRKAKEAAAERKQLQKAAAAEAKRLEKEAAAEAMRKAKQSNRKEPSAAKKRKYARMKEKDLDQFHHEPGKKPNKSSPGRVWGREKKSPKKKRAQTGSEPPSTPTTRTKPQDPGKPRLSDSPVSGRSLTPDDKGFYDWRNLWPRLKVTGWTYRQGKGLTNWLYARPNRNPHDKNAQLGIDFFDSQDAVIEYCRQADIDEGEVKKTPKGAAKSSKKRNSPTKTEQSGVTGDFDMEAIESPPASSSRTSPNKKRKVDSVWWKTHPVPTSMTAWRILVKKLGFRHSSTKGYRTPDCPKRGGEINVDFFPDIEDLRALLCKTGIPNFSSAELTEEERDIVKRWVATANTPLGLDDKTSVAALQQVPIYSDVDAWTLLRYRLDWTDVIVSGETRYYKPGAQDKTEASRGEDYFLSLCEVQDYLRAQGPFDRRLNYKWIDINTPSKGKGREAPNEISSSEYLALTFWAARSPLPVHSGKEEDKDSGATSGATDKDQNPAAVHESHSPSSSSAASSPSSTFGPYEEREEDHEEEEDNGEKDRARSSTSGGFMSLIGNMIHGRKEKESPVDETADEDAPTTPDEKKRRENVIKDSQEKMRSLPDSPAKAADSWPIFWNKMQLAGWELRSHDRASRDVYYAPKVKGRESGGEEGVDCFTSEEEVRQYAVDHLGWGGNHDGMHQDETILETFATPAPEASAQDTPIDELEGETRKKALINLAIRKMHEIRKETPGASPVHHGDNWLNVKNKMIHSGWNFYCTIPKNKVVDFVVLLPEGRKPSKGGKPGIDYLMSEEEAKEFAIEHFDWCGIFDGIDPDETKIR